MTLKHKKILIGGIIAATTVGTLTAILVPILSKEKDDDNEKKSLNYKALVAKIVAAKDEQAAKDQAMKLYGLELKNDDDISSLEGGEKERYDAALALGVYIFGNKDDYKISVYEGKDKNALKQLLLVFRMKTSQVPSQADAAADWPTNKIDTASDTMAFLYTIFKDKFVHGKSQAAKIENPVPAASDFKTKEYEMLQLYYALKAKSPSEELFSDYNMAIDDNEYVIKKFKDYMMSLLKPTPSYVTHDDLSVEAKMEGAKVTSNKAPGQITFKYGGLKDIINDFSFTHNEGYSLEIKTGSESKVANEVTLGDIKFASSVISDVEIYHVGVSSKKTDGSTIEVTFKSWDENLNLVIVRQDFGGFASYKTKAWEIVNKMMKSDFDSIATAEALASGYDKKGILDKIKAKIDTLLTGKSYMDKVKDAVVIDDITLQPDDAVGSLNFIVKIGDQSKTFESISGFLTNDQKAINDVVAEFKKATKDGGFDAKDEGVNTNLLIAIATTLENSKAVDASTLDGSKTHVELGFIQPSASSDIAITYEGSDANATAGTVIVTATITNSRVGSSAVSKKVIFKLSGLESSDQEVIDTQAALLVGSSGLEAKDYTSTEDLVAIVSTLSGKESILPSELKGKKLSTDFGFSEPSLVGVVLTYEIVDDTNVDDATGTLIVKATLTKGTNFKVMKFKLSEYQTSADRESANRLLVAAAVAEFKKAVLLDGLNAMESKEGLVDVVISGKDTLLASVLAAGVIDSTSLGFTAPTSLTNVDVEYSIAAGDANDLTGKIIVTATIKAATDESVSSIVYFRLSKYKIISITQKAVNDVAKKFKDMGGLKAEDTKDDLTATSATGKSSVSPTTLAISDITSANLGFTEPSSLTGVDVGYSIASGGADDSAGTIIVKVTITKTSTDEKVVFFKLSGYLTDAQKAVNDAAMKFKDVDGLKAMDTKDSLTATNASGKSTVLPSEFATGAITSARLGFTAPGSLDNVSVVYLIVNSSKTSYGEIIVKATITSTIDKSISSIVYFKLSGYKVQSNSLTAINDAVVKFKAMDGLKALSDKSDKDDFDATSATGKSAILPSELAELAIKDPISLGFVVPASLTSVNVVYTIIEEDGHDDAKGTLIVKAVIKATTTNALEETVYFKLSGYQTTVEKGLAQKAVADVVLEFKKTVIGNLKAEDSFGDLTATAATGKASKLPSELATGKITSSNLGFTEPSPLADVNVEYSIAVDGFDDDIGTLIVKATIIAVADEGESTIVYFQLNGYQTTNKRADIQGEVDGVVTALKATGSGKLEAKESASDVTKSNVSSLENKESTLPSSLDKKTTKEEIGFTIPSISSKDIIVTYEVESHSDSDGTLIVKAVIEKEGAISKTVYFKLSEYQTTAQKEDLIAVTSVATKFKDIATDGGFVAQLDKDDATTSTSAVNKSGVDPSTLSGTVTTSQLGIEAKVESMSISGVIVVYAIEGVPDVSAGTLVVKVTLSKTNTVDQVLYFKLGGYQTSAQKDALGVVTEFANKFKEVGVGKLSAKESFDTLTATATGLVNKESTLPSSLLGTSPITIGFIEPSPKPSNVDVVYSIYSSRDADGTLVVKAIISKIGVSKTVYFKLEGYQTATNKAQATASVTEFTNKFKETTSGKLNAKDLASDLTATRTNLSGATTTLPSDVSGSSPNEIGFIEPSSKPSGVSVVYSIESRSDNDGTLVVKAIISKSGVSKTVYFELNGYQTTTLEATAAVTEFTNKFKETTSRKLNAKDLASDLTATRTNLSGATTTLPSDVSGSSPNEIGFIEPSSKPSGVSVVYSIESRSDNDGTLVVKAIISKSGVSKTVYFELNGYQTTTLEATAAVTEFTNKFKETTSGKLNAKDLASDLTATRTNLSGATTTLPSDVSGSSPNEIGFIEPSSKPSGVSVVYSIESRSDNDGTLVVKAIISKSGVSKTVYFELNGYQTTTLEATAAVTEFTNKFKETTSGKLNAKDLASDLTATRTNLSGATTTLPSDVSGSSPNEIGFIEPSSKPSGVSVVYSIESRSNNDGTLVVKAIISKSGVSKTVYFELNGYQTTTLEATAAVTEFTNKFKETTSGKLNAKDLASDLTATRTNLSGATTTLPSDVSGSSPNEIGFIEPSSKPSGVSVVYSIESRSDNDGTLVVKAIISKSGVSKTVYFELNGYQTTTLEATAAVTEFTNKFKETTSGKLNAKDLASDLTATRTNLSGATTTLPSDVSGSSPNEIGFIEPSSKPSGVSVVYSIESHSDNDGTLVVKAIISKSGVSKTVYFELNGYQTTTLEATAAVTEFTNKFKETTSGKLNAKDLASDLTATRTNLSGATTTLPSDVSGSSPNEIGFIEPSSKPSGVSVVYSIESRSDNDGTLVVKAIISKSGVSKTVYFELNGYQTTTLEATAAVTEFTNKFKETTSGKLNAKDLASDLTATRTNLSGATTTLPSDVSGSSPNEIGFIEPSSKPSGVSVVYSIESRSDNDGTLVVKAIISKSGVFKTVYFELNGYQTTALEATAAVTKVVNLFKSALEAKDSFSGLTTTATRLVEASTTLPSSLNDEITKGIIGFIEPNIADVNSVTYSVHSHSNADGTLIVKAIIAKSGTSSQTVYFELNGYKITPGKSDLTDVTEFVNKFKETTLGKLNAKDSDADLTATATSLPEATVTLPSSLSGTSSTAIGFIEPSSKPSGVVVVYLIHSYSDADGVLVVKATISKNSESGIVYFELNGFSTS